MSYKRNAFVLAIADVVSKMGAKRVTPTEIRPLLPRWPGSARNAFHNHGRLVEVYTYLRKKTVTDPELLMAALFHCYGYEPKMPEHLNSLKRDQSVSLFCKAAGLSAEIGNRVQSLIRASESLERPTDLSLAVWSMYTRGEQGYFNDVKLLRSEQKGLKKPKDYNEERVLLLEKMLPVLKSCFNGDPEKWGIHIELTLLKKSLRPSRTNKGRLLYADVFDPFHKGHIQAIKKACSLGYSVTVALVKPPLGVTLDGSSEVRAQCVYNDIGKYLPGFDVKVDMKSSISPYSSDLEAMLLTGCNQILRSYPSREKDKYLAEQRVFQAEHKISTVLVETDHHYESSMIKDLCRNYGTAHMLSSMTRAVYSTYANDISLLVYGISGNKKTVVKDAVVIDLNQVAKEALSYHPEFSNEGVTDRLSHYVDVGKYLVYMDKIRPLVMTLLRSKIKEVCYKKVVIAANKLCLWWEDLLRICNYNVTYVGDLTDELKTVRSLAHNYNPHTFYLISKLEGLAMSPEDTKKMVEKEKAYYYHNYLTTGFNFKYVDQ